jgi:nuclear protein NHN1
MTIKNQVKPVNQTVLEKLGNPREEPAEEPAKGLKRKASETEDELTKADKPAKSSADRRDKKKEKKSAADRREELLKQLKAVENAIAKKRTKIDSER